MVQLVSDCLRTMRLALGRRNENDPDSNDTTLLQYLNDAITLTMTTDVKIFEQYGTLTFTIDETVTDGVYTFNEVGAGSDFSVISNEGFVSLATPPDASVSWNKLQVYYDPGIFYQRWGVNNTDILIPGYPTEMLFYGTELVFRTIPNTAYIITLYGYKILPEFTTGDDELPQPYWMRYLAYLAARNYARDYRYEDASLNRLEKIYSSERKYVLTRTFNQRKHARCQPQF